MNISRQVETDSLEPRQQGTGFQESRGKCNRFLRKVYCDPRKKQYENQRDPERSNFNPAAAGTRR